ncbi:ABC transporter permease subunit [Alteromonas sp. 5E99-2]|uniref:ABC transporter permease subunit n=1 Tax=Alteromonas sp. 5E99-2 TaxID=2817683 RepID=UPI001A98A5C2|nr:ABC transporter permease subunit [Alteromonas sp. 5E99-2]MBO1255343.1 ABC transporter permease subunit [Alteromonas sp. 5E99-2]
MSHVLAITQRELRSVFTTPVAYVFILIFLMSSATLTFFVGDLYERNQADLVHFFTLLPWLFLFLVPAIGMRTWSEERKLGTIELLMTLPISLFSAVMGKFLASWLVIGLSLLLTFPLWLTVAYLGEPDLGVVITGYFGSWLMASAFLAITMFMSALNKNQVVAFILGVSVCFLFVVIGSNGVLNTLSTYTNNTVLDTLASFSFLSRFDSMARGVIALDDVVYFLLFTVIWLSMSLFAINMKKAD